MLITAPAFATVYTVKPSGGDYSTISSCASAAQAGDTCEVYDGTYSGGVSPPRDGSAANWITFKAAAGNSPVMSGGWSIGGRDYIEINGFTCGAFSGSGITNVKIMNNLIQNVHDGISLRQAFDILVSGNTFNNISGDMIRQFGQRWVVRNNTVMGETDSRNEHMDFWQSWCESGSTIPASYVLIENNSYIDISGGNVHFTLINSTNDCSGPPTNHIYRYNKVHDIGSRGHYIDANAAHPSTGHNVIYNNTYSYIDNGSESIDNAHSFTASDDSSAINNILVNSMSRSRAKGFSGGSGWSQSYNLYYSSNGNMSFSGAASNETGAVKNQNPLLVNPANNDFSLQEDSPAIDSGGPLTNVASGDSGSGTSLIVDDANFFQDGWAGADPDWIAVGTTSNVVQILSINYGTGTITLASSISRNDNDPIYLYKDSDGTRVLYGSFPDIGASEYNNGAPGAPAPVNNLRIIDVVL